MNHPAFFSLPRPVAVRFLAQRPVIWAVALTLAYLAWILAHWAPAIMSPDANGYVVQGRLIATEGRTFLATQSPAQYVGTHWLETGDGIFHSRYPAGLPVIFALAWKLGGLRAALVVNPLLSAATVLLTFLLARRVAGGWTALLAAAVVATNATAQQHALDADAHAAAAFFLTAGVLALLRFADDSVPWWGLLAGALLGVVPTVRYPEALAGVAVVAWIVWRVRPVWRAWPAVIGATLPFGALLLHNASAFGAFWRTGYAITGEQTGFGWSYFTAHALSYLQSLGGAGLGVFFAFSAAGLAAMIAGPRDRATGALLAGIVVPLLLLYMAYYFGAGDGNLRFLVPTFPLLAAAGAWLLTHLCGALGPAGRAAWITVAALQLGVGGATAVQTAVRVQGSLQAAAQAGALLTREAPPGSVVILDHMLGESLDANGRWRLVEQTLIQGGTGAGRPGLQRGVGGGAPGGMAGPELTEGQPSPQQANKNRRQHARYDGVPAAERSARVWADIREWAGANPVFWLARSFDQVEKALPADATWESIAQVDAPNMMVPAGAGGGGRGGGPIGPPGFAGSSGQPMMGGRIGMGPNFGGPGSGRGGGPTTAGASQKLRLVKITFATARP